MPNWCEVVVQFVNQRNPGRDIHADDFGIGNLIQIFDQRAQAVAVRCDQHALSGLDGRSDGFIPVGQNAVNGVLEAFGERRFARFQADVSRITMWSARIVGT
jgi:hypothetical protein